MTRCLCAHALVLFRLEGKDEEHTGTGQLLACRGHRFAFHIRQTTFGADEC